MSFSSRWLRKVFPGAFRASRRATAKKKPRSRLLLEQLEDRLTPSISLANTGMLSDTAAGNVEGPSSVTSNGRYVVYENTAANLAQNQTMPSTGSDAVLRSTLEASKLANSADNIFLYDRATGKTTLISQAYNSPSGQELAADGSSRNPVISAGADANGNYWIAYVSNSDNLVSGVKLANDTYSLVVQGFTGGTFALTYGGKTATLNYNATATDVQSALQGLSGIGKGNVSVSGGNGEPFTITFTGSLANGASSPLTADGSKLTGGGLLSSSFTFLGGHNEFLCDQYNVYLAKFNPSTGAVTNTLVSHLASDQGAGYQTTASGGTSGILTGAEKGQTSLASQTTSVSISKDGGFVTYVSTAGHLMSGQQPANINVTNPPLATYANVFVYDRGSDTNYLVSREDGSPANSSGAPTTPGDGTAYVAVIDQNGDTIAFTDQSTNLVHGQTINSNYGDIQGETPQFFVAKLNGKTWASVSMALASHDLSGAASESITNTNGPLDYPAPVLTPDGHWMVYMTDNAIVQNPISGTNAGQGDNYYLYDTTSPTSVSNNTLISHTPGDSSQVGNAAADSFLTTTAPPAAVSDNGKYVAFYSAATNLTSTASSAGYNVFLFNANTSSVTRITNKSIPAKDFPSTNYPPLTVSVSGDGRYVAYVGFATADIAGLTNDNTLPGSMGMDAMLYDQGSNPGTSTPTYTLLSHAYSSSTTTSTGEAYSPVVSDDGSTVLYLDDGNNLLPTTVNGHTGQDLNAALATDGTDLYAYSLNTPGGYTPVNGNGQSASAANGTNATVTLRDPNLPNQGGNGASELSPVGAVSSDGTLAVFTSEAPNLVANEVDTSLTLNVYLYNRTKGTTTLISHAAGSSATTGNGLSTNAVISGDGSTVLFYSFATNLISGETFSGTAGKDPELYLYDVSTGALTLVSHTPGNATQAANGTSPVSPGASTLLYANSAAQGLALPSVSSDGKYVAYLSNATNLGGSNTGTATLDAFLYDRAADTNTLISHASGATTTADKPTDTVAISADGSTVAFTSKATNLLSSSVTTSADQLYVWSRTADSTTGLSAGQTVLASHAAGASTTAAGFTTSGTTSSGTSSWGPLPASLSPNGAYVAYYFGGNNLVASQGGTASPENVFLYDVHNNANVLVSHADGNAAQAGDNPANTNQYEASGPAIAAGTSTVYVAYANNSTNLLPTALTGQNGQDNVYLYTYSVSTGTGTTTLVSHAGGSAGTPDTYGGTSPGISADGRYVSFINLALPANVAQSDLTCTGTGAVASVLLYDGQASSTAAPSVVGGAFDKNTNLLTVGTSLAPTTVVDTKNGPLVAWDGTAPVPGDRNGNLDVFFEAPAIAPTDITLVPVGSVPPSTATPVGTEIDTVVATPNQTYTYALVPPSSGTNNNNLFSLTTTGVLTTATTFSVTTATTYTITVQATVPNTTLSLTKNLTVTVYPQITSLTLTAVVPPPTTSSPANTVVGTLTTADPNPNQSFTYVTTGTNDNLFTITNGNELALTKPITTAGPVTVGIQVTDTLGLTLTQDVTVNIYKPITSLTLTATVPPPTTASPAKTVVGTLTTTDPNPNQSFTYVTTGTNSNLFTIANGNQLEMTNPITTAGPVTVGIKVTDTLGLTLTQDVTVNVYQPITSLTFAEATPPPTTVSPSGTKAGTLTTTDPNPNQTFSYVLTGSNANLFTVDSSGVIKTASTSLTAGPISLGVQVTDTLGLTLSKNITVTVYQPITGITLTPGSTPLTTASPAGAVVGTVSATDPNSNQTLSYSLAGPNAGLFTVNGSGVISTTGTFATAGPITVTLVVTDTLGLTLTKDFTITVYAPITDITLSGTTVKAFQPAGTAVGTLTTVDPNANQTFVYTLTGPNANLFTLNGDTLETDTVFAVTAPTSYSLGVHVVDTADLTFDKTFTITADVAKGKLAAVIPTEGRAFSGTAATFTGVYAAALASDFTASIDWGDGTSSAGTVTGSDGTFTVSGNHTYADEGALTATVTLTNKAPGTAAATASGTVDVAEADALSGSATPITATEGTTFTGEVATFTDTNTANKPSDFTASIAWGDGTTTTGTVAGSDGTFTVSGTHTYTSPGTSPVSVTLTDDAPGTASATAVAATAAAVSGDVVVVATAANNTLTLTRTPGGGAGSITYALNGGPPVSLTGVRSFTFQGAGGNNTLVVDAANGTPLIPGGVYYDGGSGLNPLTLNANGEVVRTRPGALTLGDPTDVHFTNTQATNVNDAVAVDAIAGPDTSDRATAFAGLTAQERFVQALFLDELGRPGTKGELDSWAATFSQPGLSPTQAQAVIAAGVQHSPEAQDHLVKSWYLAFLGRPARGGEEMFWVSRLQAGQTEEQVLGQILASPEFYARAQTLVATGTTDQRYVQALYQVLLDRTAADAEAAFWVGALPTVGRQGVAQSLLTSPEFRTDQFDGYYIALLHRPAEGSVLANFWAGSNLDMGAVRVAFESSSEFFVRG